MSIRVSNPTDVMAHPVVPQGTSAPGSSIWLGYFGAKYKMNLKIWLRPTSYEANDVAVALLAGGGCSVWALAPSGWRRLWPPPTTPSGWRRQWPAVHTTLTWGDMDAYGGPSQHTPAAPAACGATGAQKQQGNQLQPQPGVLVKLLFLRILHQNVRLHLHLADAFIQNDLQ